MTSVANEVVLTFAENWVKVKLSRYKPEVALGVPGG
jgi:hypothetical protein